MTDVARFRILALDGGGVKGAYTAAVLASIEEATGKRVAEHFDLIAGTSTGGLLALGLGLGLSASELLEFYAQRGPMIFPSTGVVKGLVRRLRHLVRPKHSAAALDAALREVFQDRRLGDSGTRLVIPAYDPIAGDVHVFKTAHHERVREDYKRSAVEVARATSAAPTFLPLFKSSWGQDFLDGGLWANCPSTVAILEAVGVLGARLEDIQLLSIGTTTELFTPGWRAVVGGALAYGTSIVTLLMQAQMRASWAQTRLLLRERAHRIDAVAGKGVYSLDNARQITKLVGAGKHDGRHHSEVVLRTFLDTPALTFVPIYKS